MLSPKERELIRALVGQLAAAPAGDYPVLALMAGLPARPEALAAAREELGRVAPARLDELDAAVARLRGLLASVAVTPAPGAAARSSLEVLLEEPGPHQPKVEALLAQIKAGDRTAVPAIKARLPRETDAFVLATLASAIGHLGLKEDAAVLLPLLDSRDARVVANTLDALNRLEAEAPVEQVRDLMHAADHRLRLSALSLLARSDPVSCLLALPPLLAERHATLTGGIALLLGDLGAQPLATDLLLELAANEESPAVVKLVCDGLKRHAGTERRADIERRVLALRCEAAAAKVPLFTALLSELGVKNLPPAQGPAPEPAAGEAIPYQFQVSPATSTIPGMPRTIPRPASLTPVEGYQSGVWKPSGGVARPRLASGDRSGKVPRPEVVAPEPPVRSAWKWAGGGAFVLVGLVSLGMAPAPVRQVANAPSRSEQLRHAAAAPPAAPRESVAHAAPAGDGEGPLGRPAPKTLGPSGQDFTVEGKVVAVANHRVIVQVGTTFYSLRGSGLDEVKPGDTIRRRARLSGVARDGMVLATVGSA